MVRHRCLTSNICAFHLGFGLGSVRCHVLGIGHGYRTLLLKAKGGEIQQDFLEALRDSEKFLSLLDDSLNTRLSSSRLKPLIPIPQPKLP